MEPTPPTLTAGDAVSGLMASLWAGTLLAGLAVWVWLAIAAWLEPAWLSWAFERRGRLRNIARCVCFVLAAVTLLVFAYGGASALLHWIPADLGWREETRNGLRLVSARAFAAGLLSWAIAAGIVTVVGVVTERRYRTSMQADPAL